MVFFPYAWVAPHLLVDYYIRPKVYTATFSGPINPDETFHQFEELGAKVISRHKTGMNFVANRIQMRSISKAFSGCGWTFTKRHHLGTPPTWYEVGETVEWNRPGHPRAIEGETLKVTAARRSVMYPSHSGRVIHQGPAAPNPPMPYSEVRQGQYVTVCNRNNEEFEVQGGWLKPSSD